jgi:hypothetical protein
MVKISEKQATVNLKLSLNHSETIFRNNNGKFKNKHGQWVRFGLGTGTSDFIGWTTQIITADMVGRSVAIFTAIEIKASDETPNEDQQKFIDLVKKNGGIAKVYKGDKYAE